MQKFEPKINTTLFSKRILEIQENEGNNATVVSTLEEKLKEGNEQDFYENFMRICNEYNVGYYGFEQEDEAERYGVVITFNGYDSLKMKYADKHLDISIKLAEALYSQVAVMIKNEEYLQNMKE